MQSKRLLKLQLGFKLLTTNNGRLNKDGRSIYVTLRIPFWNLLLCLDFLTNLSEYLANPLEASDFLRNIYFEQNFQGAVLSALLTF